VNPSLCLLYCIVAVPKGVPISVKAVYFNATAITVEWKEVDDTVEVMRGVLLGYRVGGIRGMWDTG